MKNRFFFQKLASETGINKEARLPFGLNEDLINLALLTGCSSDGNKSWSDLLGLAGADTDFLSGFSLLNFVWPGDDNAVVLFRF